jgi:signal peptidase II
LRRRFAAVSLRLVLLVAVVSTIGCDRVTKHVALASLADGQVRSFLSDTIRLQYVENTGGFLGLGAELPATVRTTVFTAMTGAVLLGMGVVAWRYRWRGWLLAGTWLLLAGGASNWVDRVLRGSVVDFMNVGVGPLRTGIFNVADVAILLGVAIIAWTGSRADPAGSSSDAF